MVGMTVCSLQKVYKSSWAEQRDKGFELTMDSLAILTAKAKRDLASNVCHDTDCTTVPSSSQISLTVTRLICPFVP